MLVAALGHARNTRLAVSRPSLRLLLLSYFAYSLARKASRVVILIHAFEFAPATLLAPFVYTQLLWTMLVGYLVFGDFPDGGSILGMAIIVGAGLYLVGHQRLAVRK